MSGQKTPFLLSAATFLLLEVAALVLLHSSSTVQNIWINRASHRTKAFLWGGGEALRNQFRLDDLNQELQAENARLQERLRAYELRDAAQEEQEYVAPGVNPAVYHYIPATVVKMSRNQVHNYIILNKGSEDGIRPQSGIISDRGVVGIVEAVSQHYSYALLGRRQHAPRPDAQPLGSLCPVPRRYGPNQRFLGFLSAGHPDRCDWKQSAGGRNHA